ncbi:MAG TPA: hypothetical protein VFG20_14610 [Planctomycetaceae bacterium]|nr:hypothetical protein [Planctomycetaceae bacterium]
MLVGLAMSGRFMKKAAACGKDRAMGQAFQVGDPVVFRMTKFSTDPGPRAVEVQPARSGETYSYVVDKFWTVGEVAPDNTVVLVTRRGKQHRVAINDLRLRPANLWERWFYRKRFPRTEQLPELLAMERPKPKAAAKA